MSSQVKGKQVEPIFEQDIHGPALYAETKHFLIDHPTLAYTSLVHSCLEGPENAVYARGRSCGYQEMFPPYWYDLVDHNTITVHITPNNRQAMAAGIFVSNISGSGFELKTMNYVPAESLCYSWFAVAERKDVPRLVVERPKIEKSPTRGDSPLRRFALWLLKLTT